MVEGDRVERVSFTCGIRCITDKDLNSLILRLYTYFLENIQGVGYLTHREVTD